MSPIIEGELSPNWERYWRHVITKKENIPYSTICACIQGDEEALKAILKHYEPMIVELSKRTIIIDNNTTKDVVDEDIRAFIESELALAIIGKYDVTRKEKRNRSKPTSSQTITYPSSPLERLQRADSISTPVSVVESGSHEGSSLGRIASQNTTEKRGGSLFIITIPWIGQGGLVFLMQAAKERKNLLQHIINHTMKRSLCYGRKERSQRICYKRIQEWKITDKRRVHQDLDRYDQPHWTPKSESIIPRCNSEG